MKGGGFTYWLGHRQHPRGPAQIAAVERGVYTNVPASPGSHCSCKQQGTTFGMTEHTARLSPVTVKPFKIPGGICVQGFQAALARMHGTALASNRRKQCFLVQAERVWQPEATWKLLGSILTAATTGGGGGGPSSGDKFVGKLRFSVWCRSFPHEIFLCNLGHFSLFVHPWWRR